MSNYSPFNYVASNVLQHSDTRDKNSSTPYMEKQFSRETPFSGYNEAVYQQNKTIAMDNQQIYGDILRQQMQQKDVLKRLASENQSGFKNINKPNNFDPRHVQQAMNQINRKQYIPFANVEQSNYGVSPNYTYQKGHSNSHHSNNSQNNSIYSTPKLKNPSFQYNFPLDTNTLAQNESYLKNYPLNSNNDNNTTQPKQMRGWLDRENNGNQYYVDKDQKQKELAKALQEQINQKLEQSMMEQQRQQIEEQQFEERYIYPNKQQNSPQQTSKQQEQQRSFSPSPKKQNDDNSRIQKNQEFIKPQENYVPYQNISAMKEYYEFQEKILKRQIDSIQQEILKASDNRNNTFENIIQIQESSGQNMINLPSQRKEHGSNIQNDIAFTQNIYQYIDLNGTNQKTFNRNFPEIDYVSRKPPYQYFHENNLKILDDDTRTLKQSSQMLHLRDGGLNQFYENSNANLNHYHQDLADQNRYNSNDMYDGQQNFLTEQSEIFHGRIQSADKLQTKIHFSSNGNYEPNDVYGRPHSSERQQNQQLVQIKESSQFNSIPDQVYDQRFQNPVQALNEEIMDNQIDQLMGSIEDMMDNLINNDDIKSERNLLEDQRNIMKSEWKQQLQNRNRDLNGKEEINPNILLNDRTINNVDQSIRNNLKDREGSNIQNNDSQSKQHSLLTNGHLVEDISVKIDPVASKIQNEQEQQKYLDSQIDLFAPEEQETLSRKTLWEREQTIEQKQREKSLGHQSFTTIQNNLDKIQIREPTNPIRMQKDDRDTNEEGYTQLDKLLSNFSKKDF